MLVGITGQIGAGKTSAAKILARLGASVIDADRIGREVVNESPALRKQLVRAFGSDIANRSGRIRRQKLADIAFADRTGQERLNELVHPYLLKKLRRHMSHASRSNRLVVIDAALLLDWGIDKEMDLVLVIHAFRQHRLTRLMQRGMSKSDALARERAQPTYREFRECADHVILNNGTTRQLETKIRQLHDRINDAV